MATNENLIPIPGRLHSVATEGHVAGADEIFDDTLNKNQATINSEVNAALGEGGTVDEKIAEAIDDALEDVAFIDDTESSPAVVPGFDPTTDTVHVTAQTLSEQQKAQVRENIGLGDVDAKINEAVASEASQRAAAVSGVQSSVNAESSRAQAKEAQLQNNIEALTQSNIVVVADHTSVSSPDPLTIYREQGTNTYSDWMYQNGSWMKMAEYDNAIDDVPTAGSDNLVKSGGVASQLNPVFDVIEKKASINLFDKTKAELYTYVKYTDGNLNSYQTTFTTDYIPITVFGAYGALVLTGGSYWGWACYNQSKQYTHGAQTKQAVFQDGDAYVRFSGNISDIDTFMIVAGTSADYPSSYVRYGMLGELGENVVKDGNIDKAAVNEINIKENAVTETKTVFFDESPNLFNPNDLDVEIGYLNGSGTVSYNQSYKTSGWIAVNPSTLYYFESTDRPLHDDKARCVTFYTSDKTYISGSLKTTIISTTSPNNASWMRVTYNIVDWNNGQVTLLQKYPYSRFGFTLKEEYIPGEKEGDVPEIVFPSMVYALKGYENSIYLKNIQEYQDPMFSVDGNGGIWNYLERCLRTEANSAGNISFKQKKLRDLTGIKTITLGTSIGNPSTDNGEKKVNVIGDSFTYDGRWFGWMNTICPNLSFVGMRQCAQVNLKAEGRGGWRLDSYFQPYGDLTPSHMQPFSPFMHVSGYTYYGPIEFWKAVVNNTSQYTYGTNGFDDYISQFDSNGYKVNPTNNDLMYDGTNDKYVYWNGSSWADFSGTPTFEFDYAKYISTWNISSPDFVLIMLGVNDWFGSYSDEAAATWDNQMSTVIQSILDYATSANKTITIGICTNVTVIGTPNNNYYKNVTLNSRYEFLGRKNTINTFDTSAYRSQGVYVIDTGACLDPDYGFEIVEVKPFDYYEGVQKVLFDNNGIHPSGAGYKQLGTCAAGFIQYIRGL